MANMIGGAVVLVTLGLGGFALGTLLRGIGEEARNPAVETRLPGAIFTYGLVDVNVGAATITLKDAADAPVVNRPDLDGLGNCQLLVGP